MVPRGLPVCHPRARSRQAYSWGLLCVHGAHTRLGCAFYVRKPRTCLPGVCFPDSRPRSTPGAESGLASSCFHTHVGPTSGLSLSPSVQPRTSLPSSCCVLGTAGQENWKRAPVPSLWTGSVHSGAGAVWDVPAVCRRCSHCQGYRVEPDGYGRWSPEASPLGGHIDNKQEPRRLCQTESVLQDLGNHGR